MGERPPGEGVLQIAHRALTLAAARLQGGPGDVRRQQDVRQRAEWVTEKGLRMDRDAMAKIDGSRERLRRFVEETNDEDLARPVEGDWTAAALLAHTAFWDRRAAWLVRLCQQDDCGPSPVNLDAVNESALPQWRLIPPRAAAQEALDAAEDIDGLLPSLSTEQLAALRESKIRFDRSNHRNDHLDQIERALGRS